jgi:hypothetical protein
MTQDGAEAGTFIRFAEFLRLRADPSILNRTLSAWVQASDKHFPQSFLGRSLGDVIEAGYGQLANTKGIGARKVSLIVDVLRRAAGELISTVHDIQPGPRPPAPTVVDATAEPTARQWADWTDTLRRRGLDRFPVGRLAESLQAGPWTVWEARLSDYTALTLHEFEHLPKPGPARRRLIVEVIRTVAGLVSGVPTVSRFELRPVHASFESIHRLVENATAESGSHLSGLPREVADRIFRQAGEDLGDDVASIFRRRVGDGLTAETLDGIGTDLGLTRERVRQLTTQVEAFARVRWPEGRGVLSDLIRTLVQTKGTDANVARMRAICEMMYGTLPDIPTRSEFLTAWRRTSRRWLTPLSVPELGKWLTGHVPGLSTDQAEHWLDDEGFRHELPDGRTLLFGPGPIDTVLWRCVTSNAGVTTKQAAKDVGRSVQGLKTLIARDPRIIEEDGYILTSESIGFRRSAGEWQLQLKAAPGLRPRAESVPITTLLHLTIGGMLTKGVADATVWGVRRFADRILTTVYGATLSASIGPFVLATLFVRFGCGVIRQTRRRRLRWDAADGSEPYRGKLGWIEYVVGRAGVVQTVDELRTGMTEFFQDYEPYVFANLGDTKAGGEWPGGVKHIPGVPNSFPPMVAPETWVWDPEDRNVSLGVTAAADRIAAMAGKNGYPMPYVADLPWLRHLVELRSQGPVRWLPTVHPRGRSTIAESDDVVKG